MHPNLELVVSDLRRFVRRELSRQALEHTLADRILAPPMGPVPRLKGVANDERALAYLISEVVCGMDGPDQDVEVFADRVLDTIDQLGHISAVLEMLPLLQHHDEFSILVSKHERGLIAPDGMSSIIAKRFQFDAVQPWLAQASLDDLQRLCDLLESEVYLVAYQLVDWEIEDNES